MVPPDATEKGPRARAPQPRDGGETTLERRWSALLSEADRAGRRRSLRLFDRSPDGSASLDGAPLVDFASNDYLGLAADPALRERAIAFLERWGNGAAASRLISGNLLPHLLVEEKVARCKGTEAALLLPSGWQANVSVLGALLDRRSLGAEPLVFSDRENHASLHHGCALAGVRQRRYRHLDLDHLEDLLQRHVSPSQPRFILSETVFSMSGRSVDVAALLGLAERYGAFLVLDDAHATGALGPGGGGLAVGLPPERALVLGTFGKALGGSGAYVAGSRLLRELLINRCSGLIHSTGLPPAVLGAMDAALDRIPAMDAGRARLQALADRLRARLHRAGLDTFGSDAAIVPVHLGDERRALEAAAALAARGLLAPAIRPPTVPHGTSRLRCTVGLRHGPSDVDALAEALVDHLRGSGR